MCTGGQISAFPFPCIRHLGDGAVTPFGAVAAAAELVGILGGQGHGRGGGEGRGGGAFLRRHRRPHRQGTPST